MYKYSSGIELENNTREISDYYLQVPTTTNGLESGFKVKQNISLNLGRAKNTFIVLYWHEELIFIRITYTYLKYLKYI